jgi:SAM-dependent methyltransferase
MSTIQTDFDRIALVSPEGSLQNDHYHNFLLRQLAVDCQDALEIGCGKGEFSRRLAEKSLRVLALDLSPEMIRIARERSAHLPNLEFRVADVMSYDLPSAGFDCIASLATLHHLPLREILLKMKAALKPGGVLLILDLFEPAGVIDSPTSRAALSRSPRRLGRARAPRYLSNDERSARPLRRDPSWRKDQKASAVAIFDHLAKVIPLLSLIPTEGLIREACNS